MSEAVLKGTRNAVLSLTLQGAWVRREQGNQFEDVTAMTYLGYVVIENKNCLDSKNVIRIANGENITEASTQDDIQDFWERNFMKDKADDPSSD